ncbi:MAG: type II toxin-antitoxin system RatA family toxin [Alcanivoracaceae bacterium]|nr:type II toxin-antitoxin system RatA family toxin [Alcanivoracaceae bacterium]
MVNSIETYPQFLKWCHDSHLIEKKEESMIAGMTVSLAGIKQKFTTQNVFKQENKNFKINLSLLKGPFEKLSGFWVFTHLNDEASKIELHLEFNFKSGILNSAFKSAFGRIAQQLVSDFVKRANHVYC